MLKIKIIRLNNLHNLFDEFRPLPLSNMAKTEKIKPIEVNPHLLCKNSGKSPFIILILSGGALPILNA